MQMRLRRDAINRVSTNGVKFGHRVSTNRRSQPEPSNHPSPFFLIRLPVTQHRPPVKQHREPAQRCKVPFQIEEITAFEEDESQDFDHVAQRTDTA